MLELERWRERLRERFAPSQSTCLVCFGELTHGLTWEDFLKRDDRLCGLCRKQLTAINRRTTVMEIPIQAIYLYTPFFENLIFQFKEAKDLPLAPVFLEPYATRLRWQLRHKVVVSVPSSPKRIASRGYVPVVKLFQAIGIDVLHPFEKDEIKQSRRSAKTRSLIHRHVRLVDTAVVAGKDVVLVDDVCTTGHSLRACYDLLKPHAKSLSCLVIAIHPELVTPLGVER
jgi:predicted amidophosphoribosyltransferase